MKKKILQTQPYKGTKDWYPEDLQERNFIFDTWIKVAQRYGYEEYDTPLLEEASLYRVKSGDEIANNQLYSFKDKGNREVAIRPEMTPSLARLVAKRKNELTFPLRWFNIGKYYRYERPQKGRNREFFQLNIDILGVSEISAEVEIIQYITDVMREFKAPKESYELRISSRDLLNYLFDEIIKVEKEMRKKLSRALDNYLKMEENLFKAYLEELGLNREQVEKILGFLNWEISDLKNIQNESKGAKQLVELFEILDRLNTPSVVFSPSIVRGLAYYTGIVLEMFEVKQGERPRAMFGGGRYDNLLEIFGKEKIPAFGLGWGDETTLNFLKYNNLLPQYSNNIDIFVCLMDNKLLTETLSLTSFLRSKDLNVLQQLKTIKLSKQIKYADRKKIPYIAILGEDELNKGVIQIKDMNSRNSFLIKKEDIIAKMNGS
ncbi:histidine--tRNA ligase [Candidatus Dojkabacteria bacterium]|uniref:Histidine--tRNA ligase n=1 Tax=Candidatus Dojkabacteria bacterium TaxID=2099670 RepID=A0A847VDN5_9BACT|nr:histidine--tRNA ligase [Candidatus Dojkabacteria bacterium]